MNEHVVMLKALSDPTRLKLLKLIMDEELCVCELQPLLGISQPAVSQHLAKLKTARLISERKAGMWTYYCADRQSLQQALQGFAAFLAADPATLPDLAGAVARRKALKSAQLCCQPGEGTCT